jgi:hypothetical protein
MASPQMRLAIFFAFKTGAAVADNCTITPDTGDDSWLDCIQEGGSYTLPPGTFILNRHFQMPDGVTILGSGPGETIIEADHAVENGCGSTITPDQYPGDPTTRIGFVLGNDCTIGGFTYLGKDDHRWQDYHGAALCGGAVFETPGCADAYCAGDVIGGESHGGNGVKNITIRDVVITGKTPEVAPQLAVFITQTMDLDQPTHDVHISGVHMDHSWCDGINLHGATYQAIVENCDLSFQGDDNLAVWSARDFASEIIFRNNVLSQAKTTNYAAPRWGNCIALYGGGRITVENNTCYHTSDAGVKTSDEFKGEWGNNSQITVTGMVTDEDKPACTNIGQQPALVTGCEAVSSADSLEGWVKMEGTNCYEGYGASTVPPGTYAPDEGITAVACMAACAASTIPCTAVATTVDGGCWLATDIDLDSCQQDADFDMWLSPEVPTPQPSPPPSPDPAPAPAPTPPISQSSLITSAFNNMCLDLTLDYPVHNTYLIVNECPDPTSNANQPLWNIQNGQLVFAGPSQNEGDQFCAFWAAEVDCQKHDCYIWLKNCSETSSQTWGFDADTGEMSIQHPSGNFCLDMPHGKTPHHPYDENKVRGKPCVGAKSQKWSYAPGHEIV